MSNELFVLGNDWIVNNIDEQKIAFVSHVGDIVDTYTNEPEWVFAREQMDRLRGLVPFGMSVGNHDMVERSGDTSNFQQYFPSESFEDYSWYGGAFDPKPEGSSFRGNNVNSYQLFSAEGLEFIVLHLECNAPDPVLEWANNLLVQYSDRRAIITTHMYLGPINKPGSGAYKKDNSKGRMAWSKCHGDSGNTAVEMWEKCFRKHSNVFLILSGDQGGTQAFHQESLGDAGNTVHEFIVDYWGEALRIFQFYPKRNLIRGYSMDVESKTLINESHKVKERFLHQFELYYPMGYQSTGSSMTFSDDFNRPSNIGLTDDGSQIGRDYLIAAGSFAIANITETGSLVAGEGQGTRMAYNTSVAWADAAGESSSVSTILRITDDGKWGGLAFNVQFGSNDKFYLFRVKAGSRNYQVLERDAGNNAEIILSNSDASHEFLSNTDYELTVSQTFGGDYTCAVTELGSSIVLNPTSTFEDSTYTGGYSGLYSVGSDVEWSAFHVITVPAGMKL
ncbi:hypothetical protein ACWPKS_02265 [Coraliomargarita sp. W4R72]